MTPLPPPLDYLTALDRYNFLKILHAAFVSDEPQFIKQACMLWLVNYPGDLYVQYLQGKNLLRLEKEDQAQSIFESLMIKDPLFIEPVQSLTEIASSGTRKAYYQQIQQYLLGTSSQYISGSGWLKPLWEARDAFNEKHYDQAIALIHQTLVQNPPSPLPAILHLKSAYMAKNQDMLNNLSEIYLAQWPQCLQINIIRALSEINNGREAKAVERLHWSAAHDSAGQVITRLLGKDHRYQDLWPQSMEIYFDLPIPASVNAYMGWNQLKNGAIPQPELMHTTSTPSKAAHQPTQRPEPINESRSGASIRPSRSVNRPEKTRTKPSDKEWATDQDFEDIQKAFSRLARKLKKPELERTDSRFPVYIILCSRKQLEAVYGPNTAAVIDDLLKQLVNHIRQLQNWGALLFYPDDPAQMSHLGLRPILATDAWKVKLALKDLDDALARQGEMIGAVLIVGGPEIIPFHHLPNPTNDSDVDVPSDNPYATIDENYFLPQWPVGRLPGESGPDAGQLLSQIRHLVYSYEQKNSKTISGISGLSSILQWILRFFSNFGLSMEKKKALGYSAEIWQESSSTVFSSLGKMKDLWLSPPNDASSIRVAEMGAPYLGYFNLHGVQDGPNWYGQRNFSSGSDGPDYPIALTPAQFSESAPAPELVFTEACYGAHIFNKKQHEALSLKCLDSGSEVFVGSTCIAYGSVTLPLIAADFLAHIFWKQILDGYSAGYALMRAKLSLAQEMTHLQGFLDGEDQKTLLSFVLYGDPLAVFEGYQAIPKTFLRFKTHPMVKTISDSDMETETNNDIMPGEVKSKVKRIVDKYLPGLQNAEMSIRTDHMTHSGTRKSTSHTTNRYVVTLKKSILASHDPAHLHIARMTFNQKGQLIKLTTSR
jgi:tetratricopeptide (TPR) repeat protein